MPDLTDGGQDNIAVVMEICGCISEGMPNLADGGQDNSAVLLRSEDASQGHAYPNRGG